MPTISVKSGRTLLVSGPASIKLVEGAADVVGGPLLKGRRIIVRRERQLPVEALEDSILELFLGEKASWQEVEGSTIPDSWTEAAGSLLRLSDGTAVVIGSIDVGKTTLSTYLANRLVGDGRDLAILDADIGQADIGPPTTISIALLDDYVTDLSSLEPDSIFFVGHTSPNKVAEKVIRGIKRLRDEYAGEVQFIIINTDGWVIGEEAMAYKARLIDELNPELVIGIGSGNELEPILQLVKGESMLVRPAEAVKARSRSDRKELREAGYRKYLRGAKVCTFQAGYVQVRSALSGENLNLREYPDEVDGLRNLIVGLLDHEGYLLEIGILLDVGPKRMMKVYCRPTRGVVTVELGLVKLGVDGSELGYFDMAHGGSLKLTDNVSDR